MTPELQAYYEARFTMMATEMLVGCSPYEENRMVYTVTVETRPEREVIDASQGADSI